MDSATAALLGSLLGGSATIATAWITQRWSARRERIRDEILQRELLYSDFVGEVSKLALDSFLNRLESAEKVFPSFALLNRIRIASSPEVLAAAERTVMRISDQYFSENMTLEQLREMARSHPESPLKEFSEACRAELEELRRKL